VGWATFWAIFSQTQLVTLDWNDLKRSLSNFGKCVAAKKDRFPGLQVSVVNYKLFTSELDKQAKKISITIEKNGKTVLKFILPTFLVNFYSCQNLFCVHLVVEHHVSFFHQPHWISNPGSFFYFCYYLFVKIFATILLKIQRLKCSYTKNKYV
jgi:hypothetical protein